MSTEATPKQPVPRTTRPKHNGLGSTDLAPIPNHPHAHLIGKHADDPAWQELMAEIRLNREREKEAEE